MSIISDVKFTIYAENSVEAYTPSPEMYEEAQGNVAEMPEPKEIAVAERIDKADLIRAMKGKTLAVPTTGEKESLSLGYSVGDKFVEVSISNMSSDVKEERFKYDIDSLIVIASIEDDDDYGFDYHDAKLSAENSGSVLSMEDFLKKVRPQGAQPAPTEETPVTVPAQDVATKRMSAYSIKNGAQILINGLRMVVIAKELTATGMNITVSAEGGNAATKTFSDDVYDVIV